MYLVDSVKSVAGLLPCADLVAQQPVHQLPVGGAVVDDQHRAVEVLFGVDVVKCHCGGHALWRVRGIGHR